MNPDSDPAIFVIDLKDAKKNCFKKVPVFCLLLFESTFTSFFNDKKSKISHIAAEPDPDSYL
jgi:hypothetical protein